MYLCCFHSHHIHFIVCRISSCTHLFSPPRTEIKLNSTHSIYILSGPGRSADKNLVMIVENWRNGRTFKLSNMTCLHFLTFTSRFQCFFLFTFSYFYITFPILQRLKWNCTCTFPGLGYSAANKFNVDWLQIDKMERISNFKKILFCTFSSFLHHFPLQILNALTSNCAGTFTACSSVQESSCSCLGYI